MKDARRPGRPPLDNDDRSVGVHVKFPGKEYDELYAAASRHRLTVPEVIRRRMAQARAMRATAK